MQGSRHVLQTPMLVLARWLGAAAALASIAAVITLSIVPGSSRPHVLSSGDMEHFAAYLGTGLLIASGLPPLRRWRGPLVLIGLAALLEVAQIFVPGRSPGFGNWLSSSAGACLGALAFHAVWRRGTVRLGLGAEGR